MGTIREYLVRTPDGHDYGRDADLDACKRAADRLGSGAKVFGLDEFLCMINMPGTRDPLVVYTVS